MKKIFLLSTALIALTLIHAQSIPNADFETWTMAGPFETPDGWAAGPSASKSTSANSGSFAIQLRTDTFTNPMTSSLDTIPGRANTGTMGMGPGAGGTNGYAFTSRPDSLVGWYRFAPMAGEMCSINVNLTKWNTGTSSNDIVGTASFLGSAAAAYTRFSIPINYSSANLPDTANIELANGDPMMRLIGATLLVDDLAFITNPTAIPTISTFSQTSIHCFPNPAQQYIQITNLNADAISIYSPIGQMLQSIDTKGRGEVLLDLSIFNAGCYFIRTSTGETQQIVINH